MSTSNLHDNRTIFIYRSFVYFWIRARKQKQFQSELFESMWIVFVYCIILENVEYILYQEISGNINDLSFWSSIDNNTILCQDQSISHFDSDKQQLIFKFELIWISKTSLERAYRIYVYVRGISYKYSPYV